MPLPLPIAQSILKRISCRACQGPLLEILNLGDLRLNAFSRTLEDLAAVERVPLVLMGCQGCGLVQLDRTVPQDLLYRHYWYRSSVNESMVEELKDVVREAISLVPVQPTDRVMDIGANDGTLL